MSPPEILVDARGHRCPVPTLRLRRALEAAPPGARVRLLADDPLARIDVPHFAAAVGAVVIAQETRDGALSFLVEKSVSDFVGEGPAKG
ncbi:sulfurtransferase TusA family protein [Phenylobacterium sp.]|uniref:sulfurtransferase TusA family protein n=1 Tax=Phenylobacterium sp. TaxID=1871053 RepID=UPI0030016D51